MVHRIIISLQQAHYAILRVNLTELNNMDTVQASTLNILFLLDFGKYF